MSSLHNPDYLLHLCKKYSLSPSKKYGQNFLIDEAVIEGILAAADLQPTDTVVEVGPGFGVLTLPLAEKVDQVISFEIEKKLEVYWDELRNKETQKHRNIEIQWGNVLRVFPHFCISAFPYSYKVVANLPYQITSPVIRLFLEAEHPPTEMTLMVQKEVAERICAKPGDMSLLAISVQYYAKPEYLFTVPRTAFWPSPAVDSAVIRLRVKSPLPTTDPAFTEQLFTLVKAGFANRRKLLFKNLLPTIGKQHKADLERAFADLKLLPTVRAQELSVEEWVILVSKVMTTKL